MKKDKYASIHYHKYLEIDRLLSAQHPRSEELGKPAHDEMLFIIIHQAYELWFKQILHELKAIVREFSSKVVDEKSIGKVIYKLKRIVEIEKLLIQQIHILETMSSLDFLDFREYLFPASGFQSVQFRKVEIMLGLESNRRITYNGKPYHQAFHPGLKEELQELEDQNSLKELIEDWLERTPFLEFGSFDFLKAYKQAVYKMLDSEQEQIQHSPYLKKGEKQMRMEMLGSTESYFKTVLDEDFHKEQLEKGVLGFSYRATIAALMIRLYRDEPILYMPNQLLSLVLDVDELLTTWRFRHAQMVKRMLGGKIGTGGSSGHKYLKETAKKHEIFEDLYNISTLLIPRSELPELPDWLTKELGFYYSQK